jgi:hypothetical protein
MKQAIAGRSEQPMNPRGANFDDDARTQIEVSENSVGGAAVLGILFQREAETGPLRQPWKAFWPQNRARTSHLQTASVGANLIQDSKWKFASNTI